MVVFLIEHRRRVVPKDELLDQVWSGAFLSDSVIARTVMKARHCIGDNGAEPRFIKTIHRVGYRFVAPVRVVTSAASTDTQLTDAAALEDDCPTALPVAAWTHRIAMLPFENQTGDAQFSWVELGLLSMVNRALESDARLSVSSITTVLKALDLPGDGQDFEAVASKFRELLGVGWVGQATVRQTETGFSLRYTLIGPEGLHREGVLQNRELTALGRQLASTVEDAIFAERSLRIALDCEDPMTNQLFARYAQAYEKGQFSHALNLIRVVDDMSPGQTSVRLAHVHVLGKLLNDEVFAVGEALLRDAQAQGDERLAAFTHVALSKVISETQGDTSTGRHHHREILRIANRHHGAEWTIHLYLTCTFVAFRSGDAEEARILLGRAAEVCEVCGNMVETTLIALNQAVIEAVEGNLQTAQGIWERFVRRDSFHQPRTRVTVRMNLAEVCAAMGQQAESLGHAEDAARLMLAMNPTDWTWSQVSELCCRYSEAGHPADIERLLDDANTRLLDTLDMNLAHGLIARAQQPSCLGEFDEAAPALLRGVETAIDCRDWRYAAQWVPLLLQNEMRAGRFDVATGLARRFLAMPELEANTDVIGMHLQARALDAHRAGDHAHARELLASAIAAMKPSRWSVLVRLDASWLDIERGDLESAEHALERTFRWTEQHPTGLCVQARLRHARGRSGEAVTKQLQAIELGLKVTPQQDLLLDAYRGAPRGNSIRLAVAERLPSMV